MTTQNELLREALNAADVVQTLIDQKALGAPAHQILVNAVRTLTQPEQPAPQMADPIPEHISADLERSDWTPEEALRWYAAGKHYDTVGGRARILDNGAVASNALKAMSLEYAKHKGDVALLESPTPPQVEQAEAAKPVNALNQTRPVTFGGCPFCGRQDCVAGSCMHAAKPATLSEFIRSDDSTRDAIVARVVDAAVEMQREVPAKPETERANHRDETPPEDVPGPDAEKVAILLDAAIRQLLASKSPALDALRLARRIVCRYTIEGDSPLYTHHQAAEAQPLTDKLRDDVLDADEAEALISGFRTAIAKVTGKGNAS